jgi:hypothetical protein
VRLGRKFEKLIREGRRPALTDPDVEEGQVIIYEPLVLEVVVGRRLKANQRTYLVRDHRPRLLARSLGYSHSAANTIKGNELTEEGRRQIEPEAVSEQDQVEITRTGTLNWQIARHREMQKRKIRSASNRLRELHAQAEKQGVDLSRTIDELERVIAAGHDELKRAA